MANTEGPRPASERVRKPTEKGKIYAETLTAKDRANLKDQDKDVAQKSGQKKSAHAAKPSQAKDASHKKVKKTKEPVRPRHDEFQIETLPVNRTSMKSTAVDLRAYTRAMPHTPRTVGTPDTKSAPATRKVAGQRQSPPVAVASTTTSRRLSKEAAAHLIAIRNPYVTPTSSGSHVRPEASSSRNQLTNRVSQSTSRDLAMLTQQRGSSREYDSSDQEDSGRGRAHSKALDYDPDSGLLHADVYRQEPAAESAQNNTNLRSYFGTSYLPSARRAGKLPTSYGNYQTREGTAPVHTNTYSRREDDDQGHFDYSSHPRIHAQNMAYAHDEHDDQDEDDGIPSNTPYHYESRTQYDNDLGHEDRGQAYRAAAHDHSEEAGRWSPLAAHSSRHRSATKRPASELSYAADEVEDPGDSGPSQRRRLHRARSYSPSPTRSPSPTSDDRDGVCADYPVAERLAKLVDGQRPRVKDYGADAQHVIAYSALLFKGKIVAENAYPDKLTERTWATTVWYHAAKHEAVELSPNSEILRLISRNSWVIRGELKGAARNVVESVYHFKPFQDRAAQDYNRQLAATLVRDRTFTYEIIDHAGDNHEGLYETPAIQMIANRIFYKSASDDGVNLDTTYSPFPLRGIALILAVIQCGLDEWQSGLRCNVDFAEDHYSSIYHTHIEELEAFEAASGAHKIVSDIQGRISKHGRINAKAPQQTRKDQSSLSKEAMSRAVLAYQRRRKEEGQALQQAD